MLVKLNTQGMLVVPLIDVTKAVMTGQDRAIALAPGWNEIPEADWPLAEPHLMDAVKVGKVELKAKEFEEKVKDASGKETDEVKVIYKQLALQDVRADHARKIVEECYNPKDLARWKEDNKLTTELRNLCDIQLRKIDEVDAKK